MNRIQRLKNLWTVYNAEDFGGKLTCVRFRVTRSRNTDGYYEYNPDHKYKATIAVSKYSDMRGTLLHEMIHQYQHEVLGREANHDAIFCSMARRLERKYKVGVR